MRITKRRLIVFAFLLSGCAAIAVPASIYGWMPALVPPANDAYVGMRPQQIISRLGQPNGQWAGTFGNPAIDPLHPLPPMTTLSYRKWNGTLYISISRQRGKMVCIDSGWLPKGASY